MRISSPLTGFIQLELTCADPERLLQAITAAGVEVYSIERISDLTLHLTIPRKHISTLGKLSERHGAKERILRRTGLYWSAIAAIHRPILLFGIALALGFCLFLPTRILFIQVKGNAGIPTRRILYAAQDCGICFGASRREVRSEKVKNALLSSLPELEWVGVNTTGCVAEISVRERSEQEKSEERPAVSHIIAARDGYLLSMTVTSGNPLCAPGQYVQKGQVLVSGYTDCGIYIQATNSEAEIMAQTNRHLEIIAPSQGGLRHAETGRKQKISILIGKKRINLWNGSGILDSSCGRIYKENYMTLPGGFQLPLALCVDEYIFYSVQPASVSVQDHLSSFAQEYLTQQMTAGTVLTKEEQLREENGVVHFVGEYVCQEMIGRVKQEQIGDNYG